MEPSSRPSSMIVTGRILLGVMVGASFGVAVGALVASWVYGVAAIEEQKVNASYLAGAVTVFGALIGGLIGYRTTRHRPDSADQA